jgi:hypothetical protein
MTPNKRAPDDPCFIAYENWWEGLTRRGDPIRRPDLVGEAFEAGWRAAMAEVKEAEAFLNKIRNEERRERR